MVAGKSVNMLGSEITKYFDKRQDLKAHYLGWTCIDSLPDIRPYRKYLVVNTCKSSDNRGGHWVSIGRYSENVIECFNSLGKNEDLIFLVSAKYKSEMEYNETRLQPLTSNKCGMYVVTFIEERLKNFDLSLEEVLEETFSAKCEVNDLIVERYLLEK